MQTGRLKQSDLPLAVPVVTIVWPSLITLSQASAWWEKSDVDADAGERLATSSCSSAGISASTAAWALSCEVGDEPLVLARRAAARARVPR